MSNVAMKERPILFSAPMVRALLEGRKTQTRRVIRKPSALVNSASDGSWDDGEVEVSQMVDERGVLGFYAECGSAYEGDVLIKCPYGQPGDRLYVREGLKMRDVLRYHADDAAVDVDKIPDGLAFTARGVGGMLMPRWASRLTLEIIDVRVERVKDISEEDAKAEGIQKVCVGRNTFGYAKDEHWTAGWHRTAREAFVDLFFNINKRAPKDSNPWVWALTFRLAKEAAHV